MILFTIITIVVYLILIIWTWRNLGFTKKPQKVIFILLGIGIIYLITMLIFGISKASITYPNEEIAKEIKNTLIPIFAGLNGLILMPIIAKNIDKINEEEIGKEVFFKRIIIILIIFLICTFLECGYMKTTQEGIINTYKTLEQEK